MSVVIGDGSQLVLNVLYGVFFCTYSGSCSYCEVLKCCCRKEHGMEVLCLTGVCCGWML